MLEAAEALPEKVSYVVMQSLSGLAVLSAWRRLTKESSWNRSGFMSEMRC
jgi:hypothetical protein